MNIKKQRIRISQDTKDQLIENVKRFWSDNEMPEYKTHDFGVNMYDLDKMDVQKYIWETILDNPEKTYN